jgi:hypothetical protein
LVETMIDLDPPITMRTASVRDGTGLVRLAALDSAAVPPAPLVVVEVDGELRVAMSLLDGTTIADPFSPTAEVVALLRAVVERNRARVKRSREDAC